MIRKITALLIGAMICLGTCSAETATMHREADDPAIEMTAWLGYQGMMTYGKAMPLRVRIRNNGSSDLEGKLGMNAYLNTRQYNRYETEISVPSGAEKEYVLPVSVMTKQEIYTPEITVNGKVAEAVNLTAGTLINPSAMLVGVLSTRPENLANLIINAENDTEFYGEYWQTIALDADTFPDSDSLLGAFGMLVIDDIDPASLTGKQQEALNRWVKGKHVLICGGNPYTVAYFSELTGLRVGETVTSDRVLPVLEELAEDRASGRFPAVTVTKLSGASPLASDEDGNGLVYRTETGNGRIYTTAFETGESGLNTKKTMHYFWRKLLVENDNSLYYNMLYQGNYDSSAAVFPGSGAAIPVRSPMGLSIGIAAGALVLGIVIWIILKKRDRQTWMWLALPVLVAAAAGALLVVSGGSELNQPLVAYADHLLQQADGGTARYIGINAAASAQGMHRYQLEGAPISVQYNQSVWIEEDEPETAEPTEMAMCYTTGAEETMGLLTGRPWETQMLRSEGTVDIGRVEAEIWMESDGLHGEIRNGTTLDLKAGKVITGYGYVSVPALKSGESTVFRLKETAPDPNATEPKDGEMCRNAGYTLYSVASSAMGANAYDYRQTDVRRDTVNAALDRLTGGDFYSGTGGSAFLYTAEAEEALPLAFRVDGKQVKNPAGCAVLNVEMTFLTVGKTGLVYRIPGMDKAVKMVLDGNGMPAKEAEANPKDSYYNNYHQLSEKPVFRFTPDVQGLELTSLSIVLPQYIEHVRCFLLNAETGHWIEVKANTAIHSPGRYLNAEGELYCKFESETGSYDYDIDIPTPQISMEGRAPYAEN